MIDLIARHRLERRGYSSGKKRRKVAEGDFIEALRNGLTAKVVLLVLFAVLTTLFVLVSRNPGALFTENRLQAALIVNVIIVTLIIQFQVNHPTSFAQNGRVLLIVGTILAHLLCLKLVFAQIHSGGIAEQYRFLLPVYGLAPMILSVLLGRNHGTFAATYVSLLGALLVEKDYAFEFTVVSLVSGFVAVYLTHQVRRRGTVIYAGFFVGLATTLLAIVVGEIPIDFAEPREFFARCSVTTLMGVVTAMVVSGALPILESLFRITTEASWIEMADLNHPLLKRLTFEAPGTYHHSLVVARLAEAAAEAIGANGTMCRVASYFHDIGKLTKPSYFIENINQDENPHNELTPTMSALIITAHVKDGVDLALKHNLNTAIIDVIREHHGTSLVGFFYGKALEERTRVQGLVEEGKANSEDLPSVDEKSFRYPGPTPRTRESAIISLADTIESASRSLSKPTPPKIQQLIDDLSEARLKDGQLDRCGLTLANLSKIKQSFYASLCAMMHNRISYPDIGQPASYGSKPRTKAKSTKPSSTTTAVPATGTEAKSPATKPASDAPAPAASASPETSPSEPSAGSSSPDSSAKSDKAPLRNAG